MDETIKEKIKREKGNLRHVLSREINHTTQEIIVLKSIDLSIQDFNLLRMKREEELLNNIITDMETFIQLTQRK